MTAIDEAREALELVVKWEGREVAWDTPRARDLNWVATVLRALIAEVERLSVPPSDDDREVAERIILEHFHAPDALHSSWWIRPAEMFDALAAAGFRRQGPITDEMVEAAANRYWLESTRDAEGDYPDFDWEPDEREQFMWAARVVLEAAERVRSAVPCVECSGTGWLAAYQRDGSATADSCRDCGGSGLRAAVPISAGPREPVPSPTEQESDR